MYIEYCVLTLEYAGQRSAVSCLESAVTSGRSRRMSRRRAHSLLRPQLRGLPSYLCVHLGSDKMATRTSAYFACPGCPKVTWSALLPSLPPLSLLVAATAGLMAYAADADDSLDLSARLHPADGRLLQLELARRPTLQLLELQAPPRPHACTIPLRTHSTRSARPAPPQHSH